MATNIKEQDEKSKLLALRREAFQKLSKSVITDKNSKLNEYIPTGFHSFDFDVMKSGGIPLGKLTQIFGPESSGKSTLANRLLAMAQRTFPEKVAYLVDTEYTFSYDRAQAHGVDISEDALIVYQNNIIEEVFDQTLKVASSGLVSIIVIDSIGNLMEMKSADPNFWKMKGGKPEYTPQPGAIAKKVTQFVQQLCYFAAQYNFALVGINQIRSKIGVMYGDPTDTPGGHAWKHDLSVNIRLRQVEYKEDEYLKVCAQVRKNKDAGPSSTDDTNHLVFYFEDGIAKCRVFDLFDEAVRVGIIGVAGSWLTWYDAKGEIVEKLQGRDNLIGLLVNDADKFAKLEKQLNEFNSRGVPK